jgi:hypothetical protein
MQEKEHVSLENAFEVTSPTTESQNETRFTPWHDPQYLAGLMCIGVSLAAFLLMISVVNGRFTENYNFWICHITTLVFWAVMTFSKKAETRWFRTKIDYTLQLMVLIQIGAFALNSMMIEIFPPSVFWLQIVLTVHCFTLLAFSLRDWLPEKMMFGLYFLMGIGFAFDLYYLVLTMPIGIMGIAGIWFFGISLYGCAAMLKVIYEIVFLVKTNAFNPRFKRFFFGGMAASIVAVAVFTSGWVVLVNKTEKAIGDKASPLPAWVRVAEVLPP